MTFNKMREKNSIVDLIKLSRAGIIGLEHTTSFIEYDLGMRDSIVIMAGEDDDTMLQFVFDNFDDYILCHHGTIIVSKKYEKLKAILDRLDDEHTLGLLLGYPLCCVDKWCSMNNGEETAIHHSNMLKYFQFLAYTPCSKECAESIKRNDRIKKIILGKNE